MFIACLTNPIFINTFVVFVRLYWFEKRFQNVVAEARNFRRTRERSRTKSEAKADHDPDKEERGVGSRPIKVLRNPDGVLSGHKIDDDQDWNVGPKDRASDSDQTMTFQEKVKENGHEDGVSPGAVEGSPAFRRDIMFADEVRPPRSPEDARPRIKDPTDKESHITFVEDQRKHSEKGAFRIPGPRDFERGETIQRVDDEDDNDLMRKNSIDTTGPSRSNTLPPEISYRHEMNDDDHPIKHEYDGQHGLRGRLRHAATSFNVGGHKRTNSASGTSMTLRNRNRTKTFQSFLTARSQERDPMPYLSWAPTIGRNSNFVGPLKEEQREELGGIEYRALKTLAWILIRKFQMALAVIP